MIATNYVISFRHQKTTYFWRYDEYGFGPYFVTEEFAHAYKFRDIETAEEKLKYISTIISQIKNGTLYPDPQFDWTECKDLKIETCKVSLGEDL